MLLAELVFLLVVTVFAILLVQGTRKVPVQYAKRIVGNKQYGGARQYIPLKINAAGVMPIIFAQALMFVPGLLTKFDDTNTFLAGFKNPFSWQYNVLLVLLGAVLFAMFFIYLYRSILGFQNLTWIFSLSVFLLLHTSILRAGDRNYAK
jgi:preprotein translocase subunit SecY